VAAPAPMNLAAVSMSRLTGVAATFRARLIRRAWDRINCRAAILSFFYVSEMQNKLDF
jgi:hypothetical protein